MLKKAVMMRVMGSWPHSCEHKFWTANFRVILTDLADGPAGAAAASGGSSSSGGGGSPAGTVQQHAAQQEAAPQQQAWQAAAPPAPPRTKSSRVQDTQAAQLDARLYYYSPFYYGWEAGATPYGQYRWKYNSLDNWRRGSVTGDWGAPDAEELVDSLPNDNYSGYDAEVFEAKFDCQYIEFSATSPVVPLLQVG
jgi:hypothetical protein